MRKLRSILALSMAALLATATPVQTMADQWVKVSDKWKYLETTDTAQEVEVKSGWRLVQNEWYHFDSDGLMQTGWYHDADNRWYYLNSSGEGIEGAMKTGWYCDPAGKWYWLNPTSNGELYKGQMLTGWINDGTARYYCGSDGAWIPGYTETQSSHSSGGGGGSSSGGGGGSSSGGSNGGSIGGGDDPEVLQAKDNVIAFDSTSKEGLQEIEQVYQEIYDYWTDNKGTYDDTSDDEYNVVVSIQSPLYQYIMNGTYQKDDVIYIPACEYFPTGSALVYLSHDDEYDAAMDYASDSFEVIHTRKANLGDLFEDNISFAANELSEGDPVSFVWVPEFDDSDNGESNIDFYNSNSMQTMSVPYGLTSFNQMEPTLRDAQAVDQEADFGAPESVMGAGFQSQNIAQMLLPHADFSDIENGEIGFKFNSIVLYDKDGKKNTKADRVTLTGEVGLKEIRPELGLDWNFKLTDPLPQQFIAKLSYVDKKDVKLTFGGDIKDMSNVLKSIKAGLKTHNNKRSIFGIDIEGVDMSNTAILAAVGFNVGTKTVKVGIKSLRDQSIKVPLAPTFIVMFLLDMEGKVSTTVVGQYTSSTYVEKGINVQKDGYIGSHGTCTENQGTKNIKIGDRHINIYDLNAKSRTEKNQKPVSTFSLTAAGKAELSAGVGAGIGIMIAGIIPAQVKGTVGPEAAANLEGKVSIASDTGMKLEGSGSLNAAIVAKAKADVNLTASTFFGKPGITGSWDLAKFTLLELNMSTTSLKGTVKASDSDRDNDNNLLLADAKIELKKKDTGASTSGLMNSVTGADGAFQFDSLSNGTYLLTIQKTGYKTFSREIEIKEQNDELTIFLDRDGAEGTLSGVVMEADEDLNLSNNLPIEGVLVTISKISSSTTEPSTVYTDAAGKYTLDHLPHGLYEITFEKENFITVRNEVKVTSSGTIHNATLEIISDSYGGEGTASGKIINALNGESVGAGIELEVYEGYLVTTGTAVTTTTTDEDGNYQLKLPAGIYTGTLKDTRDPAVYLDDQLVIKVLGGMSIDRQNGEMTPILGGEEIRIVLTWGSTPRDLDSHLWGPAGEEEEFHTLYSSKNYVVEGVTFANLDIDDTSSYGPETTTIYHQGNGVYRFLVHDYTNRSHTESMALANSGAYVRVYRGNSRTPMTFHVPYEGGTVWNVFEYDSTTKTITPVNEMGYESNPVRVGQSGTDRQALYMEEPVLKDYELEDVASPSNADKNDAASPSNADKNDDTTIKDHASPSNAVRSNSNSNEPPASEGNEPDKGDKANEENNLCNRIAYLPFSNVGDLFVGNHWSGLLSFAFCKAGELYDCREGLSFALSSLYSYPGRRLY